MTISVVIFLNIISAVTSFIITWNLMQMLGYSKYAKERQSQAEEERTKKQMNRMTVVMNMCDLHMNSVPSNVRTMDRKILVPYKDLIKIWDICWHTKDNL